MLPSKLKLFSSTFTYCYGEQGDSMEPVYDRDHVDFSVFFPVVILFYCHGLLILCKIFHRVGEV